MFLDIDTGLGGIMLDCPLPNRTRSIRIDSDENNQPIS